MMLIPPDVKVHLAVGYTDLRKGLDRLAVMMEQVLDQEADDWSIKLVLYRIHFEWP
jgi:hypothetical protein